MKKITVEDFENALKLRHAVFSNKYDELYSLCNSEGKAYVKGSCNEFMEIVRLIYGKGDYFIDLDLEEGVIE